MATNTPGRFGCLLGLSLVCASAVPALSGQAIRPPATNQAPDWVTGPALAGPTPTTAGPPPSTAPSWSPLPLAPAATPGWVWLPTGSDQPPGWSPPTSPLINKAPVWQGL